MSPEEERGQRPPPGDPARQCPSCPHELTEDPHDLVAGVLVRHTSHLALATVRFATADRRRVESLLLLPDLRQPPLGVQKMIKARHQEQHDPAGEQEAADDRDRERLHEL
jgi:hypothetical protein